MNRRTILGLALATLLALVVALPLAVRADAHKGEEAKRHHVGRMRLYLVLRMADRLGLSDEKALAVDHVLMQMGEKRQALRDKRFDLEKQIRQALDQAKPDGSALAKLVEQAVDLHKQQGKLAEESFTALKKVLTVEEQAKLVLLRSEMRREFRRHGWGGEHHWQEGEWHRHEHGDGPDHDRDHGRGGHPEGDDSAAEG